MTTYKNPTLRHHNVVSGMNQFTFNTREQYIEFRTDWKKGYKELTSLIRETKVRMKNEYDMVRSAAQSYRVVLRRHAREMMEVLTEAKETRSMQVSIQKEGIFV